MLFNDEGYIECKRCHGDKIIRLQMNDLVEVCPDCNGDGGCDWVEHAMGRRHEMSKQIMYNAAHRNIQTLIHMICEEGRKMGEHVNVKIEHRPIESMYIPPVIKTRR